MSQETNERMIKVLKELVKYDKNIKADIEFWEEEISQGFDVEVFELMSIERQLEVIKEEGDNEIRGSHAFHE